MLWEVLDIHVQKESIFIGLELYSVIHSTTVSSLVYYRELGTATVNSLTCIASLIFKHLTREGFLVLICNPWNKCTKLTVGLANKSLIMNILLKILFYKKENLFWSLISHIKTHLICFMYTPLRSLHWEWKDWGNAFRSLVTNTYIILFKKNIFLGKFSVVYYTGQRTMAFTSFLKLMIQMFQHDLMIH